jgi:hypothetical protein
VLGVDFPLRRSSYGSAGTIADRHLKEKHMSSFVLSFRSAPDVMASQGEIDAWGAWFQGLGGTVTDPGGRIADVTLLGADAGANALSGYAVIDAKDAAEALEIAKGCPGLAYNGSVEVGQLIVM